MLDDWCSSLQSRLNDLKKIVTLSQNLKFKFLILANGISPMQQHLCLLKINDPFFSITLWCILFLFSFIELPKGKKLTIVVIGKPGSGKSATANNIVGKRIFTTSSSATSTVSSEFQIGRRTDERKIDVLDMPGSFCPGDLQNEAFRILELAPKGFHAIVLVARYGCRFTDEDARALQLLQRFLGDNVGKYIILVLSFGDQAEHEATADKTPPSPDELVDTWLQTSPDWVQTFIDKIGEDRVVSFNNRLKPHSQPEAYKRQLSKLIKVRKRTSSFGFVGVFGSLRFPWSKNLHGFCLPPSWWRSNL